VNTALATGVPAGTRPMELSIRHGAPALHVNSFNASVGLSAGETEPPGHPGVSRRFNSRRLVSSLQRPCLVHLPQNSGRAAMDE